MVFGFRTGGTGTTASSVVASADDAEQGVGGRMQLTSHDLDIGQRAGKPVGLRFTGLEVPDGATVTGAYIEFEAKRSGRRPADIQIAIEDTTDAATFGCGADIRGRDWRDETTVWAPEPWVKGETHRTADLAATIASLVGTDGLDADDALAFRFKGMDERTAWSFDGEGAAARLVIEFESGTPDPPSPVEGASYTQEAADVMGLSAMGLEADSFRFLDTAQDGSIAGLDDYLLG